MNTRHMGGQVLSLALALTLHAACGDGATTTEGAPQGGWMVRPGSPDAMTTPDAGRLDQGMGGPPATAPDMAAVDDAGVAPDDGAGAEDIVRLDAPPARSGPLEVERLAADATKPVTIWAPRRPGRYAVVLALHGFLLDTGYTSALWTWVASHGFVVVAPQMHAPDGLPIGKPSAAQETVEAIAVLDAIDQGALSVTLGTRRIETASVVLVGHSRGAKVAWGVALERAGRVAALAGLDPVDGTGGPGGGEARVIAVDRRWTMPCLVVGTGLGPQVKPGLFSMACAPQGDNHVQFYSACAGQATELVAEAYGHLDILDDDTPNCGLTCTACVDGPARKPMREFVAASLVRLLRATFFDHSAELDALRVAPQELDVTVRQRN